MPVMESVTLENFRCFRERQTVRLAPLTLLVGENSTGKTSFLALIRVLAQLQLGSVAPDFKEPPYDLGSFDEIAYFTGGRTSRADSFTIGFAYDEPVKVAETLPLAQRGVYTFCKRSAAPELVRRSVCDGSYGVDEECIEAGSYRLTLKAPSQTWTLEAEGSSYGTYHLGDYRHLLPRVRLEADGVADEAPGALRLVSDQYDPRWSDDDERRFVRLAMGWRSGARSVGSVFAGAPVRSTPRRTYDPARSDEDPEGDHVPMYLAELARGNLGEWQHLKQQIDAFGKTSGLFDELRVRLLGRSDSDPFQLQVRKGAKRTKGPFRNLIDVGYGVSQALPLVTELLRTDGAKQFLLQQPEVHLHPSAQAALGTLFCNVVADGRQLIVESHSDHLMNRIRMDVRDGATELRPEDVLLLYFERDGLDVRIHEISFDEQGNVCSAPDSYRDFFRLETRRSLGL